MSTESDIAFLALGFACIVTIIVIICFVWSIMHSLEIKMQYEIVFKDFDDDLNKEDEDGVV